jgi:hypothetical protein
MKSRLTPLTKQSKYETFNNIIHEDADLLTDIKYKLNKKGKFVPSGSVAKKKIESHDLFPEKMDNEKYVSKKSESHDLFSEKMDNEKYVSKKSESLDPLEYDKYPYKYVPIYKSYDEINFLLAQISSQLTDLQTRITIIENKLSKIENYAITDIEI